MPHTISNPIVMSPSITTRHICKSPSIICHKVHRFDSDDAVREGIQDAAELFENEIPEGSKVRLLLDFSDFVEGVPYLLSAHRVWAHGFKENSAIRSKVARVAIYAQDSEKFRAEKAQMETPMQHFFTDYQDALTWLAADVNNG